MTQIIPRRALIAALIAGLLFALGGSGEGGIQLAEETLGRKGAARWHWFPRGALLSDRELRARKERQALSEQMGELVAENEALRAQLLAHESALRGSQASLLRLSEAAKNAATSARLLAPSKIMTKPRTATPVRRRETWVWGPGVVGSGRVIRAARVSQCRATKKPAPPTAPMASVSVGKPK